MSGTPHSDAFHLNATGGWTSGTSKFSSRSTMPSTTRPWSATVQFELVADSELIEYVCENEKDVVHLRVK